MPGFVHGVVMANVITNYFFVQGEKMNDEKRKALAALANLIAASSASIDDLDAQAAEIARKRAVEVDSFNRHSEELAMLLGAK